MVLGLIFTEINKTEYFCLQGAGEIAHEISAQLLRAPKSEWSCRLHTSGVGGGDTLFMTEDILLLGGVLER